MSEPQGWPIRIAVRVDFSDGAQHEYDVRADEAVAIPLGAAYWPEGVVTSDMAKRMEHDRKRQEEIDGLKAEVKRLRADRAYYRAECGLPPDDEDLAHLREIGAIRLVTDT